MSGRPATTLDVRFWEKVDKTPDCWFWTGSRGSQGYGSFRGTAGTASAHRTAYELIVGPIPDGKTLDHLCRVRHCVNPAHLEPVTHKTNVLRGIGPSAVNASKEECAQGHEYTSENTRVRVNGKRVCKECDRAQRRSARAAERLRSTCSKGHALDEINTVTTTDGRRYCRTCRAGDRTADGLLSILNGTVDTRQPRGDGGPSVREFLASKGEL